MLDEKEGKNFSFFIFFFFEFFTLIFFFLLCVPGGGKWATSTSLFLFYLFTFLFALRTERNRRRKRTGMSFGTAIFKPKADGSEGRGSRYCKWVTLKYYATFNALPYFTLNLTKFDFHILLLIEMQIGTAPVY